MRGRVTNTETITQQENYARVNRGLSYEGEGQNRNIPSNLNSVAARDFFFDPTGATTPYSNATASLKGSTPKHTGWRRRSCGHRRPNWLSAGLYLQRCVERCRNHS